MKFEAIIDYLVQKGNEQIKERIFSLKGVQYRNLVKQIESVNWEEFFELIQTIKNQKDERLEFKTKAEISLTNRWELEGYLKEFENIGINAIKSGEVAVLIPSWHQDDIGIFPYIGSISIQPISGKSLINLHLDRILGTFSYYQCVFPLIIATDKYRDKKIKIYLQQNDYFGHEVSNFKFISQKWYPAFDSQLKLKFYTKNTLAGGCDGELGTLVELANSQLLHKLKEQGVKYISINSLTNVLDLNPDPLFIGGHIKFESEFSYKVTADVDNPLFTGSVIVNVDWLIKNKNNFKNFLKKFIYKVPVLNDDEKHINENLYFLKYDWFEFLNNITDSVCFYVDSDEEFGTFNPEIPETLSLVKEKLLNRTHRWLRIAGVKFQPDAQIELNPLFAINPYQLKEKLPQDIELKDIVILEACEDYEEEVLKKLKNN